jgi:hypothetical protein
LHKNSFNISVLDLINKPKHKAENNMTVSEVLEDIISKMFSEVTLNEQALMAYEEKYKKKSKKSKK